MFKSDSLPHSPYPSIKLLTLGNFSVGKTSIILRYANKRFFNTYLPTIGMDFIPKSIELNNIKLNIQIWDTAGQERYHAVSEQYYKKMNGVVLVFDLTNKESFTGIKRWMNEIERSRGKEVPIVLLGNKCDLEDRAVKKEDIDNVVKKRKLVYYETSALNGENVDNAINDLVLQVVECFEKRDKGGVTLAKTTMKKKECCT